MARRSPQQAGDILHREGMIRLRCGLKSIAVESTKFGENKILQFLSEIPGVGAYLPRACLDRFRSDRVWVGHVDAFVPIPTGLKTREYSHHFQHNGAPVLQALPGTENRLNARINVIERIWGEDLVGRLFAPLYELIEEIVGRLASVCDTLLCSYVVHTSSDYVVSNVSYELLFNRITGDAHAIFFPYAPGRQRCLFRVFRLIN